MLAGSERLEPELVPLLLALTKVMVPNSRSRMKTSDVWLVGLPARKTTCRPLADTSGKLEPRGPALLPVTSLVRARRVVPPTKLRTYTSVTFEGLLGVR